MRYMVEMEWELEVGRGHSAYNLIKQCTGNSTYPTNSGIGCVSRDCESKLRHDIADMA